jgi:thioredoxin 1
MQTLSPLTTPATPATPVDPIEELDDDDVADFVRAHPIAVVEVYAPWCSFCRALDPHLRALAEEFEGDIAFGRIDADFNPAYMVEHDVRSLPTLVLYKDGVVAGKVVGFVPRNKLLASLLQLLRSA